MRIKAGYRLEVVTFESDCDNYKTKTIDGLSPEEVVEMIKLVKLFKENHVGNLYDPDESMVESFAEALRTFYLQNSDFWNTYFGMQYCTFEEFYMEMVDELLYDLGLLGNTKFFTRYPDSITVYYTPVDVKLENVTHRFKGE